MYKIKYLKINYSHYLDKNGLVIEEMTECDSVGNSLGKEERPNRLIIAKNMGIIRSS